MAMPGTPLEWTADIRTVDARFWALTDPEEPEYVKFYTMRRLLINHSKWVTSEIDGMSTDEMIQIIGEVVNQLREASTPKASAGSGEIGQPAEVTASPGGSSGAGLPETTDRHPGLSSQLSQSGGASESSLQGVQNTPATPDSTPNTLQQPVVNGPAV